MAKTCLVIYILFELFTKLGVVLKTTGIDVARRLYDGNFRISIEYITFV